MAFAPIQTGDQTLDRIQIEIADALTELARLTSVGESYAVGTVLLSATPADLFIRQHGSSWVPCDGRSIDSPEWRSLGLGDTVPTASFVGGINCYVKVQS